MNRIQRFGVVVIGMALINYAAHVHRDGPVSLFLLAAFLFGLFLGAFALEDSRD